MLIEKDLKGLKDLNMKNLEKSEFLCEFICLEVWIGPAWLWCWGKNMKNAGMSKSSRTGNKQTRQSGFWVSTDGTGTPSKKFTFSDIIGKKYSSNFYQLNTKPMTWGKVKNTQNSRLLLSLKGLLWMMRGTSWILGTPSLP